LKKPILGKFLAKLKFLAPIILSVESMHLSVKILSKIRSICWKMAISWPTYFS